MTKSTDAKAAELRALCAKLQNPNWVTVNSPQDAMREAADALIALLNEREELIKERDRLKGLLDFQIEGEPYAYFTAWKERDDAVFAAEAREEELIKERDEARAEYEYVLSYWEPHWKGASMRRPTPAEICTDFTACYEKQETEIELAEAERDAALLREGQAIAARDELIDRYNKRVFEKELSPSDLRAAEKHCDWVSFKHAWNAVMNARAALNASKKGTQNTDETLHGGFVDDDLLDRAADANKKERMK